MLAGRAEARGSHLIAYSSYLFLALSTAVRLAVGLVLLKYLAWQFRPSIFGLLTLVMAVAAVFYLFAGGGITSGVIRNISVAQSQKRSSLRLQGSISDRPSSRNRPRRPAASAG